jgi:hypothetical protein
METLKNLGLEQLEMNFKWLRLLKVNLFKQIHKNEEHFELTKDILNDSLKFLTQKTRVIRVFNTFPKNFNYFVEEMNRRSKMNFFLENILQKINQIIKGENQRRMLFIQKHAENIPAQV